MDINNYLNKAKSTLKVESDAKLAQALHITRGGISRMRKNNCLGDDTAAQLSKILNIEPAVILLDIRASKSKNRKVIASVRRLIQKASTATAGLVITVIALPEILQNAVHCILC